jgi:DNA-binding NtrC family response regulator
VLQQGELERLGDHQMRRVDVRVVAATNLDLRQEVQAGHFREDLFFRLNVFPIRIPPLRERREDVPILMNHFLERFVQRHGRRVTGFTSRAIDAMLTYDWPGNIRELENVVERGVILCSHNGAIDIGHLFTSGEQLGIGRFELDRNGTLAAAERLRQAAEQPAANSDVGRIGRRLSDLLLDSGQDDEVVSLDEIETVLLKKALARAHGNVAAAARLLGITRPQMVYRLKSRGLADVHE